MSSQSSWDDYEDVADSSSMWDSYENSPENERKSVFSRTGPRENQVPSMKRRLGRHGKVIGSTIAGLPGGILDSIQKGTNFLSQKITGSEPTEEFSQLQKSISPFGGLPTSQDISGLVERAAPSLAPQNEAEQSDEEALGLITSLLTPLPTGKAKAIDPRTYGKIFKAGKALGLTEKELTPLIQGTAKEQVLGKIAKKTKGMKEAIDLTKESLSDVYESITSRASKLKPIREDLAEKLTDKFVKIKSGLEDVLKGSPDTESAAKFIESMIEKLNNYGVTPSQLINQYKEINKAVNWGAVKNGKKVLAALKEPILETLHKAAPKVGKDLTDFNLLYSKMKNFEKAVGPGKIGEFLQSSKAAGTLVKLAIGATGAVLGAKTLGIVPAAKVLVASEAMRRVASRLLTDPKWQNLHGKILTAIKNKSFGSAFKLLQIIKQKTKKEFPKEYEEIDWDD